MRMRSPRESWHASRFQKGSRLTSSDQPNSHPRSSAPVRQAPANFIIGLVQAGPVSIPHAILLKLLRNNLKRLVFAGLRQSEPPRKHGFRPGRPVQTSASFSEVLQYLSAYEPAAQRVRRLKAPRPLNGSVGSGSIHSVFKHRG